MKKTKNNYYHNQKNILFSENSPKHIKKFKKHKQTPSKKPQPQKKEHKTTRQKKNIK